jgi:hypothetical protein
MRKVRPSRFQVLEMARDQESRHRLLHHLHFGRPSASAIRSNYPPSAMGRNSVSLAGGGPKESKDICDRRE